MVHHFASKFHIMLGRSGKTISSVLFSGITELKLTNLTGLRQRDDESVAAFIQRFRDVKYRYYNLVLSGQQLADAAFNGLLPHIKDKYGSQEFESISQIASRMTGET